jgi:hypothetical protein
MNVRWLYVVDRPDEEPVYILNKGSMKPLTEWLEGNGFSRGSFDPASDRNHVYRAAELYKKNGWKAGTVHRISLEGVQAQ